jgi:hypothetical protein
MSWVQGIGKWLTVRSGPRVRRSAEVWRGCACFSGEAMSRLKLWKASQPLEEAVQGLGQGWGSTGRVATAVVLG